MLVRLVQPLKTSVPSEVSEAGRVMLSRDVQFWKAQLPMLVMLLPRLTEVRFVQPLRRELFTVVQLSPNTTLSICEELVR